MDRREGAAAPHREFRRAMVGLVTMQKSSMSLLHRNILVTDSRRTVKERAALLSLGCPNAKETLAMYLIRPGNHYDMPGYFRAPT